jgi:mannose-6-phosphate isomerase
MPGGLGGGEFQHRPMPRRAAVVLGCSLEMYRLDNRVQEYAWGSRTAIAELLGRPRPSPRPEAELWMGAHPSAPSRALRQAGWESLLDVIAASPREELGPAVVAKFGTALPFLFKVLAAETPLSLQAHPDAEQARAGFEAEERGGVPRDAPRRMYKDRNHKPELICALGPFDLLCGFRRTADTARLLRVLGVGALAVHADELERAAGAEGLRRVCSRLFATDERARAELVGATTAACARHAEATGEFARECAWAVRIAALYPGDVGVMIALLLNRLTLDAGQAIYLPAGNLHAYLGGVGLEIMANSDNVIRGGLTPKHVDAGELLRVLTFADGPVEVLAPRGDGAGINPTDVSVEQFYDAPASEFRLSRIALRGTALRIDDRRGPEILLCTEGEAAVASSEGPANSLPRGASLFVPASGSVYTMTGRATVFRATVGSL